MGAKINELKANRNAHLLWQHPEHEAADDAMHDAGRDPRDHILNQTGNSISAAAGGAALHRLVTSSPPMAHKSILRLQKRHGNRYVQRMLAARQSEDDVTATPAIESAINRQRGGGRGLDQGLRSRMESAFGADFSGVRVHTDSQSDTLNQSLQARAFTTGQDIFFRQGEFNPGGSAGQELLAHELTHVVQQNGATVQGKLTVSQPGDRLEREADEMAQAVSQQIQRMSDEEEENV